MTQNASLKALVTGASSGIGATYADRLARRGHDLVVVARDEGRMNELASRLQAETGRIIEVVRADLTAADDLAALTERLERDERIGLLVNNAGMSVHGSFVAEDAGNVARLIALNITAATMLAGAAARAFPGRRNAAIVNLSSILALAPERYDGAYSGSKAYILNLSLALASPLRDKGVHVQVVMPGATRTEIWARSGQDVDAFPPEMVMEVGELVDAALVGLDRGETVTIPSLPDPDQWDAFTAARQTMGPNLSKRHPAARYSDPS